ncbi:arsenate reductase/protein-tyrosine-phosphatase family protein [Brachybacterium aquaticum]|uniref:Protein-tyrosine phosphatase n=1 Tax=Brachybacterium aquaticum TaxID=1432564 RepID=A0A841AHC7_9MICO|nr:hypothetical protein [Brachybacterium aquaticum]MBB5832735.1 protein-tyrosine phosphatase [Brachybacterium aquaticum]
MPATTTPSPAGEPVRSVMFVCTGNVCRSAYAEHLLRHLVPDIEVSSAGTFALVGEGMEAQMAAELRRRGPDPSAFRASALDSRVLDADLVLTMSDRQLGFVVEEYPGTARRAGLVGHVPELAEQAGSGPLTRESIAAWSRLALPRGRNVPDPYRRPAAEAAACADLLDDLVGQLATLLSRT